MNGAELLVCCPCALTACALEWGSMEYEWTAIVGVLDRSSVNGVIGQRDKENKSELVQQHDDRSTID